MNEQRVPMGEAISFGWQTVIHNVGLFFGLMLTVGLVGIASDLLSYLIGEEATFLMFTIQIVFLVLSYILQLGLMRVALRFCRGEKAEYLDLFSCSHLFFKYLFASILYGFIVVVGVLLLVVPGILWSIKYQFYPYFIVDQHLGPLAALKRSGEITRGVKFPLFLFSLLLLGINFLGFLALGIGMFVTIPLSIIATAVVYQRLLGTPGLSLTPTPAAPQAA